MQAKDENLEICLAAFGIAWSEYGIWADPNMSEMIPVRFPVSSFQLKWFHRNFLLDYRKSKLKIVLP